MKVIYLLILGFIAVMDIPQGKAQSKKSSTNEMCWWYDKPAKKYLEGLPIATGRFATMVEGRVDQDQMVLNDETLFSGGPYNPHPANGPQILAEMQKAVLNKQFSKADTLSMQFSSIPGRLQEYQPMSNLNLRYTNHDANRVRNYKRKLSMDSSLVTITYDVDGVNYRREIFASYPDQVIVMRLSSSKLNNIDVTGWMSSVQPSAVASVDNQDLIIRGGTKDLTEGVWKARVIPGKMKWQSRIRIINEGGSVSRTTVEDGAFSTNGLSVTGANSVTFIIAGATNWKNWNEVGNDEKEKCNAYIKSASEKSFDQLRSRHLNDYMPLFASCKIDLGSNEAAELNTTARIEKLRAGGEDPLYIAQYFQYGRYLMLAGSRENTLGFNNHNIWLNHLNPRWQGRWTLNINMQECFWPVENTNLARLNESLVYFTEQMAQSGARTAKEMYNARGWVAHLGNDIWFNVAPTSLMPQCSTWPMGGTWLLQQLYDHYLYEPDQAYLKRIYPMMKGSAQFFLDFMTKDPETGYLVTNPSTTPENWFVYKGKKSAHSMGTATDIQIVRNLFRNSINASKTLGVDAELRKQMESALKKLPPHQIGKHGQLQEWLHDYQEFDVTHRHISHLFAVYPDDDITIHKTPKFAQAAARVLERKTDTIGWAGAWRINVYARLQKPESAYNTLHKMLTGISFHPVPEDSDITPSFEGNQGIQAITSGITEMIMQSHSGELSLLPALPAVWKTGSIKGLRGRGGYGLDIDWENGHLKESTISSRFSGKCVLRTKEPVNIYKNNQLVKTANLGNGLVSFETKAGDVFKITPKI